MRYDRERRAKLKKVIKARMRDFTMKKARFVVHFFSKLIAANGQNDGISFMDFLFLSLVFKIFDPEKQFFFSSQLHIFFRPSPSFFK